MAYREDSPSSGTATRRTMSSLSSLLHDTDRNSSLTMSGLDILDATFDQSSLSHPNRSPRRLSWCHGSGSVTLELRQGQELRRTIVVNEPMAAVLMLFNSVKSATSTLSKQELREEGTLLDDEMLSVVLADLKSYTTPFGAGSGWRKGGLSGVTHSSSSFYS